MTSSTVTSRLTGGFIFPVTRFDLGLVRLFFIATLSPQQIVVAYKALD